MRADFTPLPSDQRTHVLCIAHRGASAYAPENSLLAFRRAAEMGADLVEIDIQITADQRAVVSHDASLQRIYGLNLTVADLTLAQLRAATSTKPDVEPIPTFEEVAFLCLSLKLGLYLDLKAYHPAALRSILQTLRAYDMLPYTIIGAFRPDWLADIPAFNGEAATSVLFSTQGVDPVLLAQSVGARYVHPCWEYLAPQPHQLLAPPWIEAVRRAGLGIVTWHEERPAEIQALINLGVDAICSDTPDVVVSLTQPDGDNP
jgi:glycerophosphoryl diester phosphodiesterase